MSALSLNAIEIAGHDLTVFQLAGQICRSIQSPLRQSIRLTLEEAFSILGTQEFCSFLDECCNARAIEI